MMSVDCVECAAAQFHCVNASAHSDATERARRAVGGLSARAASDRLALQAGHASHGEWRCRCASNCCSSDLWTQILIRCTVFSEYSILYLVAVRICLVATFNLLYSMHSLCRRR